ncbi:Hypothetical protein NTJ_05830 [Nesidiocoris tenuis]|uniref:Uncharacterized protein n=1 Tax=Nesidiocoris tenuis TaxID=355587 RepID=A0ABN7ALA6_9HEMI|nr:Hypothetical protein NTJ_05830 [Nesidiocoris tenuis]
MYMSSVLPLANGLEKPGVPWGTPSAGDPGGGTRNLSAWQFPGAELESSQTARGFRPEQPQEDRQTLPPPVGEKHFMLTRVD